MYNLTELSIVLMGIILVVTLRILITWKDTGITEQPKP